MNRIIIETLGCRLNQIESESLARFFIDDGFDVSMGGTTAKTASDENVCAALINTCTVTQKSEQKARRLIRLLIKKYPNAVIIVTGCYAQLAESEISQMDSRICVIGGQIKSRISQVPQILLSFESYADFSVNPWNSCKVVEALNKEIVTPPVEKKGVAEHSFKLAATSFLAHSRASLKIQDGCNNNCSFCAIHIARGKSVSIDASTALERVKFLEEQGYEEVVITAVNIAQYKSEYNGQPCNFSRLLEILLNGTSRISFRISSLYPEAVDDDFCRLIATERVRPHFHISVQSGSNRVLSLMNRIYKAEDVFNAVQKIRAAKKNPFVACDIITGFPGETDDDFNQTVELCKKCGFVWIHAFPFSERPGTLACTLKNKVPQSVSGERASRLLELAAASKISYINLFAGQELNAVLETVRRPAAVIAKDAFVYHAVTDNFIHCEVISNKMLETGKCVCLKIQKPLEDRILKGGETEASAVFVK